MIDIKDFIGEHHIASDDFVVEALLVSAPDGIDTIVTVTEPDGTVSWWAPAASGNGWSRLRDDWANRALDTFPRLEHGKWSVIDGVPHQACD